MLLFLFFFFNDTATTESYTYLHTLSLHDALPIYGVGEVRIAGSRERTVRVEVDPGRLASHGLTVQDLLQAFQREHFRSEEHTSELQSLMRISYAVFCLKKKINKQHSSE